MGPANSFYALTLYREYNERFHFDLIYISKVEIKLYTLFGIASSITERTKQLVDAKCKLWSNIAMLSILLPV